MLASGSVFQTEQTPPRKQWLIKTLFTPHSKQQTGFKKQAAGICTHYERLLVDIVHVQSHQVLPAAQVQTALILIHQEDTVVAGVEGETEGPCCSCVHEFCVESVKKIKIYAILESHQQQGEQKLPLEISSHYSLYAFNMFHYCL